MKFSQVMSSAGEWLRGEGPHHQVVVSSRVRLARNCATALFPGGRKRRSALRFYEPDQAAGGRAHGNAGFISELLQDLSALENKCSSSAISSVASMPPKALAVRCDHESQGTNASAS